MKITKEAIHTDTEALASKMAGLTDAVADAPSEWSDEVKKSFDDMMLTGTGVMDSGKHVATSDIYLPPEQSKSTEPDYDRSIHSSPDAVRWADFYMDTWPNGCSDRDTMIGWFANAMEAMADSLRTEPQEQEWDGEGLPPVGEWCEAKWLEFPDGGSPEWVKGTYKGSFDGLCWFGCHEEVISQAHAIQFRPIQSTAERKREELIAEIEEKDVIDGSDEEITIAIRVLDYLIKSGEVKE